MRRHKFNSLRKFERLEDRWMMAGDIDLDNGVLTVEGTNNDDFITIAVHPSDSDKLLVTIEDALGNVLAQDDFDREDVESIVAYGLNGNDSIENNTDISAKLYGGNGNDLLSGGSNNDLLDGGANDDQFNGGRGNDELIGGTGNDLYFFFVAQPGEHLGTDTINESASVDTDTLAFVYQTKGINVNLATTAAQAVNSELTLRFTSTTGIENVVGTLYNDTIRGNSRNNVFHGLNGHDKLHGFGGDDTLDGGADDDVLYGGIGNDKLHGRSGNDYLFGEAGNDELYGHDGLDTLDGGADNDLLDGGLDGAKDYLYGGAGRDTFVKYKKRLGYGDYEQQLLDYDSAVDMVMTKYY